jgi:hypothetical protein
MLISINQNADLKRVVGMLMALPLLPSALMQEGLQVTIAKATTLGVNSPEFQQLCERIQNHWFTVVGAEILSVHGKITRTNNGLESTFRVLNSAFPHAHPTVWVLLGMYFVLIRFLLTIVKKINLTITIHFYSNHWPAEIIYYNHEFSFLKSRKRINFLEYFNLHL